MKTNEPVLSYKKTALGSDRSFGLTFAAFFAIVALLSLLHGGPVRWWPLALAFAFVAAAVCVPRVLRPLNWLWFKFGLALHHAINPVIMVFMFYGAITPMADLLHLKSNPKAASYWIPRDTPAQSSI